MQHNRMLHEDKFQLLIHRLDSKQVLLQLLFLDEFGSYEVSNGDTLFNVDRLKDLGITVCPGLSWAARISGIESRARIIAAWVLNVFKAIWSIVDLYETLQTR